MRASILLRGKTAIQMRTKSGGLTQSGSRRRGGDPEEPEDLELEGSEKEADECCISACMRRDDSRLEDELEYFWDAPIPSEADERVEDRWWSPEPQRPSSEEEDEEEVRYLVSMLMSGPRENGNEEGAAPPRSVAEEEPGRENCQAPGEELEKQRGCALT
jgi:hypothetical protein